MVCALAACTGILIADRNPHPWFYATVFLISLAAAIPRHAYRRGIIVVACFLAFAAWHAFLQMHTPGRAFSGLLPEKGIVVTFEGIVDSESNPRASGWQAILHGQIAEDQNGERLRVVTRGYGPPPSYGDLIRMRGVLQRIAPARNPGEFPAVSFYARRGIFCEFRGETGQDAEILAHGKGSPLIAFALRVRNEITTRLSRGISDPQTAAVILAMTLGISRDTNEKLQEDFRLTGLWHLFSVSGLHVGMLAAILWFPLRSLGVPRPYAVFIILPCLFFYALLTGLKAASLRAAIMASVVLLAFVVRRRPNVLNSLGAAALIILAADPNELFSPGFQFSFCVVLAIALFALPCANFLRRGMEPDPFLPRNLIPRWELHMRAVGIKIMLTLGVSCAAWIGSVPLIAAYFHIIPLVSIFANVVAVPLAFLILAVSLASLGLSLISTFLSILANQLNSLLCTALIQFTAFCAAIPFSWVQIPSPLPRNEIARITVFDFSPGASILVECKQGAWLIDTGTSFDATHTVTPALRERGIASLRGVIVTHGDYRHIGGGADILERFRVKCVMDSVLDDRSSSRQRFLTLAGDKKIPRKRLQAGDIVPLGADVTLTCLYPPADLTRAHSDDKALVFMLTAGRFRLLLLSDSGLFTEAWLLENRHSLACDILIKGQHENGHSGDKAFLQAASPSYVIATSAVFPPAEQISPRLMENAAELGITLLRQDATGAVIIEIAPKHLTLRPFLSSGHPMILPAP